MSDQSSPEPSMDEILASIRKIIADDAPTTPTHAAEPAPPPLRLTERVDAPPPPPASPQPPPEPLMTAAEPTAATVPAAEDDWVSEPAAATAASAFDRLSSVAGVDASAGPPIAMPPEGRSLEDVTRDLLRPILKAWLDDNLPAIVQARVDEEVERISRRRTR